MTIVQFVDAISSSPTVRLNLNARPWKVLGKQTQVAQPELRYATSQTLLTDGSVTTAGAYEDRVISLALELVNGSTSDVQNLMRELDRPGNILKWQPTGATHPVFFRTKRCGPEAIEDVLPLQDLTHITVDLIAEPFAYGLKETIATATVNNDPAAVSNGCFFDIDSTDLLGDTETPAIFKFAFANVEDKGPTVIAVRRRGTPSSAPFVLQAELMTGGTDTTIQANDAVMSGSGQNYMRCTFSTVAATMTTRLTSSTFPSSASVDARGRYAVYLRCRKSSSGADINVQLGQSTGSTSVDHDEVALPTTTDRRWKFLGVAQIPLGADPVYDGSGTELAARGNVFTISAQRTSGSGNLDFDVLLFIPYEDKPCVAYWPTSSGPTYAVVDGVRMQAYNLGASGEIYPREPIKVTGQFPYLSPGVDNRVYVLLNGGGLVSDTKTDTVDVTVEYYPRYRHVWRADT